MTYDFEIGYDCRNRYYEISLLHKTKFSSTQSNFICSKIDYLGREVYVKIENLNFINVKIKLLMLENGFEKLNYVI